MSSRRVPRAARPRANALRRRLAALARFLIVLVSLQLSGAMHVLGDVVELAFAIDPHDGHDDDCDRGDRDCPPGCPSCHTAHAGSAPIAPAMELRVIGAAIVSMLPAPVGTRDGPPAPTPRTLERPPRRYVLVS